MGSVGKRATRLTSTWSASAVDLSPSDGSTWSTDEIVEERDGYWTVRDPETGIFGSGATEAAAHEDFRRALAEHLDVLERQDSLSAELLAQLSYLRWRQQR